MTQKKEQEQNNQKQTNSEEKKEREIIIKTDGNNIRLEKAEVAGHLELKAVLSSLLDYLSKGSDQE